MLRYILPVIPEHKIYVEPFFGGGAVFFSKPPVKCEVINDLNKEAMNFYYVAKVEHRALYRQVSTTLHSRSGYEDAKVIYANPHLFDEVKRATAFYTLANQSFSANFSTWGYDRVGTTTLKVKNKREAFNEAIAQRLGSATIECDNALKVIERYDTVGTFHYVDPPYFNSDCGHYGGYTSKDFEELLQLLKGVQGKFLLSSYPSELLTEYANANGWEQQVYTKTVAVHAGAKKLKYEVLTSNYPIRDVLARIK